MIAKLLALGGVATTVWLVTPLVDMAVRGTIDQRTVASWRTVTGPATPAVATIPAPRAGEADRVPA